MVTSVQEWLRDKSEDAGDLPEEVAEAYASLIVDWNIEENTDLDVKVKRQIKAETVQELNLSDLMAVANELEVIFGSGKPTAETVKNGSGSTNGSRASQE